MIRDQETKNKIGDLSRAGSGKRMTAWYCLGTMQKRFEKIQDPVKRAEVLRFMYSGEVSEFCKQAPLITYVADLEVDVAGNSCEIKCAIFQTADQIGNVCDWSDECRLIDENHKWKTVSC